jgi:site-specific DNA recombinase
MAYEVLDRAFKDSDDRRILQHTYLARRRGSTRTLIKAIARGRKWFNELASGRARFTQEIAAREGVNGRFVRRLIPLAFLSPAVVQAIAEGRHPAGLTGEALSRGVKIPVEWAKQPTALGLDWCP